MTTLLESTTYHGIEAKADTLVAVRHKKTAKIVVASYSRLSWHVKPAKKYKVMRFRTYDRAPPKILVKLPTRPHTEAKIYEFIHPSTKLPRKEAVTLMTMFRKDLFVSVTLPLLAVAASGLIGGWSMYTHLDSKLDASRAEAAAGIEKISDVLREELRADRELRAKELEALRTELREDRRNTTNLLQELKNKS